VLRTLRAPYSCGDGCVISLNTRAWADDVQIVDLTVSREWADVPCTTINARELS
jgi:hypothetical protein